MTPSFFQGGVRWIAALAQRRGCRRVTARTLRFRRWHDRRRSAICLLGKGGSRKFVYQQARETRLALDDAFISTTEDDEVLFEIPVTKRWLRQVIVALALMCRGSYLGIIEFMRDLTSFHSFSMT